MKKRNNSYYDYDAPGGYYGGSYEYFEEGSSEPYNTDLYNPYGSYKPWEMHDDAYEPQKTSSETSCGDNYTYTPDSFDPGSAYGEIPQEPKSEYGPYSYGNYSQSTRRKKPIALAAAAVAAVIIAALLPTILHNRADAGGLPTVSYSYETPVVPTHAVQTQAPVSTVTPTPTKEPAQSTALPAVGLSADDTPYLYYRGLLSPENQAAYDIIAAGIAARQDSIELDLKDISEINTIYTYLSRDRTDLFWWNSWSSSYYEENGSYRVVLSPTYIYTPQEIEDRVSKIEQICSEVINNARFSSDYEKVKAAHDFIINRTIYDLSYLQTDISVFLIEGRGVCNGYARTFKYLMDRLGVPVIFLESSDHAWNLVCVDGKWYQIDTTWDDPVLEDGTQLLNYTYFCITDEEMNRVDSHSCIYPEELPKCDSTDANYYVVSGRMLQSYDENTLRQWLNEDYPVRGKVEFKCASEAVYRETYNRLSTKAEIWDLLASTSAANHKKISWSFDDDFYIVSIEIN